MSRAEFAGSGAPLQLLVTRAAARRTPPCRWVSRVSPTMVGDDDLLRSSAAPPVDSLPEWSAGRGVVITSWASVPGRRGVMRRAALLLVAGVVLSILLGHCNTTAPEHPPPVESDAGFVFSHAFFGRNGYANPAAQKSVESGMLNAFTFWHPLGSGMQQFLTR